MPKEKSSVSQCLLVLCLLLFVVTVDFAIPPLILAQNTILITDYGASLNDDSDDTLAIQSAITNALPGDTVLIPTGTFHVSASIIMGKDRLRNNFSNFPYRELRYSSIQLDRNRIRLDNLPGIREKLFSLFDMLCPAR